MPRSRDESPAIRVYTVCDESRYLIVRNVPALGCGDELLKLFGSYGELEDTQGKVSCSSDVDHWRLFVIKNQEPQKILWHSPLWSYGLQFATRDGYWALAFEICKVVSNADSQTTAISVGLSSGCKPMDSEDCEPYTDVYWIKYFQVSNARFAKRKLDEFVFFGNPLQVTYAPHFESPSDTKEKLEGRRKEVLGRLNFGKFRGPKPQISNSESKDAFPEPSVVSSQKSFLPHSVHSFKHKEYEKSGKAGQREDPACGRVTSSKEYFSSSSMNDTVRLVREKLDKIQSSSEHVDGGPTTKKARVDNRRRI